MTDTAITNPNTLTSAGPPDRNDKAASKRKEKAVRKATDNTTDGETTTDEQDTEGKKEGGRSTFLKVHGETYVHHTLFKDLLTIATDVEPTGKIILQLGFRDGRQVDTAIEEPDLIKVTKRMKEYAKEDKTDGDASKGRSTFLKIHGETYVHHSLFRDVVTIATDKANNGSFSTLQIGFRDGRQVSARVEEAEVSRVVKRVKEYVKKYGQHGVAAVTPGGSTKQAKSNAASNEKESVTRKA
jgi:hypothetical protein